MQRSRVRVVIVMPTLQAMAAALAELAPLPPAVAVVAALQAVIETASAPTAKTVPIRIMRDIVFLSESCRKDTGTCRADGRDCQSNRCLSVTATYRRLPTLATSSSND